MCRLSYILLLSLICPILSIAQDKISPKKHINIAQNLIEQGKLSEAATHYEAAWSLKPSKLEWLYEAGMLFLKAREYRKAAEDFGTLKANKFFPKARLQYAITLQQNGQYDEAIPEFLLYLNNYEGKDREIIQEKIEEYIQGCSMAIRQSDSTKLKNLTVEHLSENINSTENDIAPLPFGDDILYFTYSNNEKIHLRRSQQLTNDWSKAQIVEGLPILEGVDYGMGSFSADGSRFYYTQCESVSGKKTKKTSCYIYLIKRDEKGWTASQKLPNVVNTEGGITKQPFVFQKDKQEYLFFVTDRKGGKGGFDIWFSIRNLDSEIFSEAKNVGSIINTEGDEISPFYDVVENTLYFASNGRATFGGLDIFKSKGMETRWETPENLGVPFNSGADDWFFIQNKSRTGGFFVSNRTVGVEKISSQDDDIFSFRINTRQDINIAGKVYEKTSKSLLENPRVSLYERRGLDNQRLLSSFICPVGQYQFALLPKKAYILEVEKDGFNAVTFDFNTIDSTKSSIHDFYLDSYNVLVSNKIDKNDSYAHTDINPKKGKTPNNTPKNENKPKEEKPTNKPKKAMNITYKVQILAYDGALNSTNRKRIERVDDLGVIDIEDAVVNGKKYTRVLLSEYSSYEQAAIALKKTKDRSLKDAFIIRYENGKRTDRSR